MGTRLYPSIARTIAEGRFSRVFTEYTIEGEVNDAACNMIDQIVTELRTPRRRRETPREPCHEDEVSDILNSPEVVGRIERLRRTYTLRTLTAVRYLWN